MNRSHIVNLALPKTGTTTLTKALRRAGLSVADWKIRKTQSKREDITGRHVGSIIYEDFYNSGNPFARMDEFDVINEMSVVGLKTSLWPQTDWALLAAIQSHYPDVKFILTTRDPVKTADSMMRWNNLGRRRLPAAHIPGMPSGFGTSEAQLAQWLSGHYQFCRQVFRGADNFLEYDIEDSDAQQKISEYLGLELPWWGQTNVGKPAAVKEEAG